MRKKIIFLITAAIIAACASWMVWLRPHPDTGRLANGGGEHHWWIRQVFRTWMEFIIESHKKTGCLPTRLAEFPDNVQKWVQSGELTIPYPNGSPQMNGNDPRHFLLLPVVGHDDRGPRVTALILVLCLVEPEFQERPFHVHLVRERSRHGGQQPEPHVLPWEKREVQKDAWLDVETCTGRFICENSWERFDDHPLLEGMSTQRRSLNWFEVLAIYNRLAGEAEKK